jgi:hypothetical protein
MNKSLSSTLAPVPSSSLYYLYTHIFTDRAPEVLLGLPYSGAIDIWSLACVCVEMYIGLPIFPGVSQHNQLSRIVEMFGVPPDFVIEGRNGLKYFTEITVSHITAPSLASSSSLSSQSEQTNQSSHSGNSKSTGSSSSSSSSHSNNINNNGSDVTLHHQQQQQQVVVKYRLKTPEEYALENNTDIPHIRKYLKYTRLEDVIMRCPLPQKSKISPEHKNVETLRRRSFLDLLQGMFQLNPFERWTAKQAMKHPFIQNTAFTEPFKPEPDMKVNERKLDFMILTQKKLPSSSSPPCNQATAPPSVVVVAAAPPIIIASQNQPNMLKKSFTLINTTSSTNPPSGTTTTNAVVATNFSQLNRRMTDPMAQSLTSTEASTVAILDGKGPMLRRGAPVHIKENITLAQGRDDDNDNYNNNNSNGNYGKGGSSGVIAIRSEAMPHSNSKYHRNRMNNNNNNNNNIQINKGVRNGHESYSNNNNSSNSNSNNNINGLSFSPQQKGGYFPGVMQQRQQQHPQSQFNQQLQHQHHFQQQQQQHQQHQQQLHHHQQQQQGSTPYLLPQQQYFYPPIQNAQLNPSINQQQQQQQHPPNLLSSNYVWTAAPPNQQVFTPYPPGSVQMMMIPSPGMLPRAVSHPFQYQQVDFNTTTQSTDPSSSSSSNGSVSHASLPTGHAYSYSHGNPSYVFDPYSSYPSQINHPAFSSSASMMHQIGQPFSGHNNMSSSSSTSYAPSFNPVNSMPDHMRSNQNVVLTDFGLALLRPELDEQRHLLSMTTTTPQQQQQQFMYWQHAPHSLINPQYPNALSSSSSSSLSSLSSNVAYVISSPQATVVYNNNNPNHISSISSSNGHEESNVSSATTMDAGMNIMYNNNNYAQSIGFPPAVYSVYSPYHPQQPQVTQMAGSLDSKTMRFYQSSNVIDHSQQQQLQLQQQYNSSNDTMNSAVEIVKHEPTADSTTNTTTTTDNTTTDPIIIDPITTNTSSSSSSSSGSPSSPDDKHRDRNATGMII